jgi:hypothetical protein
MASAKTGQSGTGAVQTAAGNALIHSSTRASHSTSQWAPCSSQDDSGAGSTLPARASGVTAKLTRGMAIALASGLISDSWPNSSMDIGTSPSVTAYWVLAADHKAARQPAGACAPSACACVRPTPAYRITATAPNESQKPGHSTAHGSSSSTMPSAAHSTCDTFAMRPSQSAAATTDSMYSVRCAGTPNPASSTYSSAAAAPANAAAFCAGSSSGNCARVKKERRHRAETRAANSPATMVMCRPEISRWSPTTSATITPA